MNIKTSAEPPKNKPQSKVKRKLQDWTNIIVLISEKAGKFEDVVNLLLMTSAVILIISSFLSSFVLVSGSQNFPPVIDIIISSIYNVFIVLIYIFYLYQRQKRQKMEIEEALMEREQEFLTQVDLSLSALLEEKVE